MILSGTSHLLYIIFFPLLGRFIVVCLTINSEDCARLVLAALMGGNFEVQLLEALFKLSRCLRVLAGGRGVGGGRKKIEFLQYLQYAPRSISYLKEISFHILAVEIFIGMSRERELFFACVSIAVAAPKNNRSDRSYKSMILRHEHGWNAVFSTREKFPALFDF